MCTHYPLSQSINPSPLVTNQPAMIKMNGKEVLVRDAKTVLTLESPFKEKLLCDGPTLNAGDACAFSCSYCYSAPAVVKFLHKVLGNKKHVDVVVRRGNAITLLVNQLLDRKGEPKFLRSDDCRVLYTSTLVDIAGNMDLMRETVTLFIILLELTNWHIRVLTKSNLLPKLVQEIPDKWHHRLILGVSTGTLSDKTAKAIEKGTAPVTKRLESLHWLQDRGFRTFGMICPSLPQDNYGEFAAKAAEAIRLDKCEHVWAEVINVRGDAFRNTIDALNQAGLFSEAKALQSVMGNSAIWEQYARATFEAHAMNIPPDKLRFLQYVDSRHVDYWRSQACRGAVLLGRHAKP